MANPSGVRLSPARRDELAALLRDYEATGRPIVAGSFLDSVRSALADIAHYRGFLEAILKDYPGVAANRFDKGAYAQKAYLLAIAALNEDEAVADA
jgi:hypothetical protein